jgi:cellulose synthase/poly-beta-1,6-N-acetylglucosamine synthase-like glycosyltransferase
MSWLFWICSFLVIYPYTIYPVVLRYLAARERRRRGADTPVEPPSVTLVISAYNEEAVIAEKLNNALQLQYPAGRLEFIVVSDASSDRTDAIVEEFSTRDSRIRLVRQNERRGKSAGLNHAVEAARGDIVVFSDANAIYEPNAIVELTRDFSDPTVGYVVGAALYADTDSSRAAENEGLYWKLELALKEWESDYYSVVGGDGAIYAVRRKLFRPLKDDDISDFVNPLQVVAQGFRGRFNPRAICYEGAGETFAKEFGRKRRIVNRTWRAVCRYAGLLSVARHGRYIFMLASHKVIRYFALPLVALAWLTNCTLLGSGPVYIATWLGITASGVLAALGAALDRAGRAPPSLVSTIYYFYLVNLAAMLGIWDEWRGVRHATWNHIRTKDAK